MVHGRAGPREPIYPGNDVPGSGDVGTSDRGGQRIVDGVAAPPLVPNRPVALTAAVCGVLVAVVLGIRYAGRSGPGRLDTALTHGLRAVVGNPTPLGKWAVTPPTVPTRVLGALSNPVLIYAVIVAVLVFALWRRRWATAGLAVLGPGLCVLLVEILKPLFDRLHSGYLSYPSGHMASSAAALTVAVLVVRGLVAWGVWALLMLVTAAGLVAMNYHYPTDTVGGLGLALGVVLSLAVLADVLSARRARPRVPAPPVGTPPADTSSDIPRPAAPR
jgi:undecaprenyl-diphosphatase